MKIHGTAKGGALSTKDFGVAFGGGVAAGCTSYTNSLGTGGNATVDGVTIDTSDQHYGDGCLSGDGSNDLVNCDSIVSSVRDTASSINFWVQKISTGLILVFGDTDAAEALVFNMNTNEILVNAYKATYDEQWEVKVNVDTDWHMCTLTFSGSEVNFYFDGSSSGVTWANETDRGFWVSASMDNCRLFCGNKAGQGNSDFFNGRIQGVVFFNEVISSDTMAALYNSGAGAKISTLTDVCDTILCWYECDELSNSTLPNDAIPTS